MYTYLLGWSKHNKFYYGARWAKNSTPNDLWKTYFTSSRYVKQFVKEYGNPDIIQVRKKFNNAERCRLWEEKVLTKMKVTQNTLWLNRTTNRGIPTGSPEHIAAAKVNLKKAFEASMSRTITEDERNKRSISAKAMWENRPRTWEKDEVAKEAHRVGANKRWQSEDQRKLQSERAKLQWAKRKGLV
jgi:hypothetical protein